jgi:hypothetical protein
MKEKQTQVAGGTLRPWVGAEMSTMSPDLLAGLLWVAPAGLPMEGKILDQVTAQDAPRESFVYDMPFDCVASAAQQRRGAR